MFSSSHCAIAFSSARFVWRGALVGAVAAGLGDSQQRFERRRFAVLESDFANESFAGKQCPRARSVRDERDRVGADLQ
jgi:hypothetical protein